LWSVYILRDRGSEGHARYTKNDAPYHIQPRIINDSGRDWVIEGFGIVERDISGKPIRLAGTAQDITERKKAEDALQARENFLDTMIESSPT
jgi:PAS domain-containing protein